MVLLDSRAQASQWDYGLYVLFSTDDGVTDGQEIHFAAQGDGIASVVLAEETDDGVVCAVPNQLLTEARTIRIYAYVDDGDTGRTVKRWQLPVFSRPKPADYVYEETEVYSFHTLQDEISGLDTRVTALEAGGGGGGGGAVTSVNGQTGAVVLNAASVHALPDTTVIPAAYDDTAVRGLISAKYTKPSAGIPKTDLASAVQTSLGKADTALQSVPPTYRTSADQDVLDSTKVNTDDPRLTDARTPTAHTHAASDVSFNSSTTYAAGTIGAEVKSLNENKANSADVYSKTYIDALIGEIDGLAEQINEVIGI